MSLAAEQPGSPRYSGYYDLDGRFVPFELVDEVFARSRSLKLRTLLCLQLDEAGALKGSLYANFRMDAEVMAARLDPLAG